MNTPKQRPRPPARPVGWVGCVNAIKKHDPQMAALRKQYDHGEKSPSMREFGSFEAWTAHCVKETSAIVLRMINQVQPGRPPLNRERLIRQLAANQRIAAGITTVSGTRRPTT